ncbi:hypothetical protein KEM52_004121, partial [Ascosphaera acerosa]
MKVSCFNDDKKTDLIGETWLNLEDIIVPGGGKKDLWQTLNCKGKYAGDLRIELTYYDTRERRHRKHHHHHKKKPADQRKPAADRRIKRRPLPSNPTAPATASATSTSTAPTPHSRASSEYASLHMINVAAGGLRGPRDIDAPRASGVGKEGAAEAPAENARDGSGNADLDDEEVDVDEQEELRLLEIMESEK